MGRQFRWRGPAESSALIAARRRNLRWVGGLLLAGLPAFACADPVDTGRAVYDYYCYQCHGYAGDGRTLAASYLDPPPRDFTRADPEVLDPARMRKAVREGRPGTAMVAFGPVLGEARVAAVVEFVRATFMQGKPADRRYHTPANGWPAFEANADAFAFATGERSPASDAASLSPSEQRGLRLYLAACVSCHDRGARRDSGPLIFEPRAVSYPRGKGYDPLPPDPVDAASSATPYARHDIAPRFADLSAEERTGEALYQKECAFCHAADGTARNWIGSFLEPRPRALSDPQVRAVLNRERVEQAIRFGIPGSSMPAWRDVLNDAQIAAILAYLQRAFGPWSGESRATMPSPPPPPVWSRQRP